MLKIEIQNQEYLRTCSGKICCCKAFFFHCAFDWAIGAILLHCSTIVLQFCIILHTAYWILVTLVLVSFQLNSCLLNWLSPTDACLFSLFLQLPHRTVPKSSSCQSCLRLLVLSTVAWLYFNALFFFFFLNFFFYSLGSSYSGYKRCSLSFLSTSCVQALGRMKKRERENGEGHLMWSGLLFWDGKVVWKQREGKTTFSFSSAFLQLPFFSLSWQ